MFEILTAGLTWDKYSTREDAVLAKAKLITEARAEIDRLLDKVSDQEDWIKGLEITEV